MRDRPAVELPALNGLDPLGFLAALGVLRLLDHAGDEVRLSFDPVTATASLRGIDRLETAVDRLVGLVKEMPAEGLMVDMPPSLLTKKEGSKGSDPARLTPSLFAALAATVSSPSGLAWIRALWTDLALDDKDRCVLTPFSAPAGQQTLRSMFEKPVAAVRANPHDRLTEALAAWCRIDDFTGENLDYRAVRGAADQQDGCATMSGVPGATWLALSAIPLFPVGGDGARAKTIRWADLRYPDRVRRRLSLSWPVWDRPLDLHAVRALLKHPALDRAAAFAATPPDKQDDETRSISRQLEALGVQRVVVARRRQLPGGKSAGVLVRAGSWG